MIEFAKSTLKVNVSHRAMCTFKKVSDPNIDKALSVQSVFAHMES